MTFDDILEESRREPAFQGHRIPDLKYPVEDEHGECVGWYAPRYRHGRYCIGFLYIARDHRRHGHALRFVKAFSRQYPDLWWYAETTNQASQKLAEMAGLVLDHECVHKNRTYLVYALDKTTRSSDIKHQEDTTNGTIKKIEK